MKDKMYQLKVVCLTPKGKADKCIVEWRRQFPTLKKPIKEKLVNDSKFYYTYEFDNETKAVKFARKVMMAQVTIRQFYNLLMGTSNRANKLGKKFKWGVDKMSRWALKRINKKLGKGKEIDDFKDIINMEDEVEMRAFLEKDIIQAEFIGVKK